MKSFRPWPGLRSPHVQSALAVSSLRARWAERSSTAIGPISGRRVIRCEDGTRLVAMHTPPRDTAKSAGTVVLLHGWEGSADSAYMVCVARYLHRGGHEIFRLNFRDHGGTHELNPGIFHSCRLEEMVLAVKEIAHLKQPGPLFLVGFSLGGNFALRIANAAARRGPELERVIAVCPVIDPAHCMAAIERAPCFYQHRFLTRWTESLRRKSEAFPGRYPLEPLGPPTLRARTDRLIRRFTDFGRLEDYLDGYSIARDRLGELACPATIVAAADDPIIPVEDLHRLQAPDCLEIEIQRYGGHCGFIRNPNLKSWLERRVGVILQGHAPVAAPPAPGL